MKKQDLVLLIVKAATSGCKNHVTRLQILNKLADNDKQPTRFQGLNSIYWLFSIGRINLKYEIDQYNNWSIQLF